MKQRCSNPNDPAYKNYGGRGIFVCERWLVFENFYADMGDRPEGMSIDRIDNDGPYSKENCRWATRVQQARNRRWKTYAVGDVKHTAQEWGRLLGGARNIVNLRLAAGWSVEDACTRPVGPNGVKT